MVTFPPWLSADLAAAFLAEEGARSLASVEIDLLATRAGVHVPEFHDLLEPLPVPVTPDEILEVHHRLQISFVTVWAYLADAEAYLLYEDGQADLKWGSVIPYWRDMDDHPLDGEIQRKQAELRGEPSWWRPEILHAQGPWRVWKATDLFALLDALENVGTQTRGGGDILDRMKQACRSARRTAREAGDWCPLETAQERRHRERLERLERLQPEDR